MTARPILDDVRRFVLFAIPSVPYLEALLLIRSAQLQTWDPDRIAQRLYLSHGQAADLLADLSKGGIVERAADGFRYRPQDARMAQLLDNLAAAYSTHLIEISQMIHAKTSGKQHHFANAFLFRQ